MVALQNRVPVAAENEVYRPEFGYLRQGRSRELRQRMYRGQTVCDSENEQGGPVCH